NGAFGGGDDTEHQVNFNAPAQGQWVSLDIPLSQFVGLTTREHIAQYILVGQPSGASTIFVDNVYFFNNTGVSTNDPYSGRSRVSMFPNPVRIGEQVLLDIVAAQVEVFDLTGQLVSMVQNTPVIPTTGMNQAGVYVVKIRLPDGSVQAKKLIVD
ncbi:MAG: T9SS type A sorting domain-containing protein, partial [Saprospiraceae bacterium]